jgi:predicted acylesterase/phospholipase RssA
MSENESENVRKAREIIQKRNEEPRKIDMLVTALKAEGESRLARQLKEIADVKRARNILGGEDASDKVKFDLAKDLQKENQFGLARKLLGRIKLDAITEPKLSKIKVGQQHALCTYKDPDLPADERFNRAFAILKQVDDPTVSTDQETLGLAGAIYKRIWEFDAQKRHLERALSYYTKGYKAKKSDSPDYDFGYTGINAAFVQDILAHQEETEAKEAGTVSDIARARHEEAKTIREDLIATLPPLMEQPDLAWLKETWWFYATIAEAYFGLGRYSEALPWLNKAAALKDVPEWQYASTTRQLAYIAQLRTRKSDSQADPAAVVHQGAYEVLGKFMETIAGRSVAAVEYAVYGKIGLALSGGGFRASLFHIGVLARLAELDVLRRIEVISCVSGGAILGAHYQLEVRKLLREKSDSEITQQDYIDIVKRMEKEFLEGVQQNIRTRVAAELITNLKMIFFPNYSRTKRAGELYESELYSRVPDGNGTKPRMMSDLMIQPVEGPENFKPKYDNWRRVAKVPDLILNATSLNTGHNWQFTASWMGEPPAGISSEIDCNYRLRRLYYGDAPTGFREKNKVRLGDAVGASACVPGLFEPIPLMTLYGERGGEPRETKEIVVRLVDGGVHDNQGIVSLLEQGCSQMIVSDASGQMDSLDDPNSGLLSVPLRSNSILMARVREAQYQELVARRRASLLQGLIFIHLKKDLDADPLDWLECNDRWNAGDAGRPPERAGDLTSYGVKKNVQRLLASVRTDLDSFSQSEAYALMMSGYAMIERAPVKEMQTFPQSAPLDGDFRFFALREPMSGGAGYPKLVRLLEVSHMRGFKIWKLLKWLRVAAWVLGGLAVLGLIWLCLTLWKTPQFQFTLGIVLAAMFLIILGTILIGILGPPIQRFAHWRKTPSEFGIGVAMLLGFIGARIHLLIFDKLFLKYGSVERVTGKAAPD